MRTSSNIAAVCTRRGAPGGRVRVRSSQFEPEYKKSNNSTDRRHNSRARFSLAAELTRAGTSNEPSWSSRIPHTAHSSGAPRCGGDDRPGEGLSAAASPRARSAGHVERREPRAPSGPGGFLLTRTGIGRVPPRDHRGVRGNRQSASRRSPFAGPRPAPERRLGVSDGGAGTTGRSVLRCASAAAGGVHTRRTDPPPLSQPPRSGRVWGLFRFTEA